MSKGDTTRHAILEHAMSLATKVGLEGLSIGRLAEDLKLSKSGLFAHFRSKETLQIQVLQEAAGRFVDMVVRPALKAPRGVPRLSALFDRWLRWPVESRLSGGCLFVAAAVELDDQPGAVRDELVRLQRDWLDTLATTARQAVGEGHLRPDLDPEQFAHDLYGVMLAWHHASRLLRDPKAEARARAGFARLLQGAGWHVD